MSSRKSIGRVIAFALLLQVVLAPNVYFRWMRPGTQPGFLESAAEHASAVRVGALLAIALASMTLVVALALLPSIRRHSERLGDLFVGLALIGVATIAFETVAVRHMLTLSLEYARPDAPTAVIETLAATARADWVAAHYTNLMFSHVTVLVMYLILLRLALVPGPLAVAGLLACSLSTITVTSPLVGTPLPFSLVAPMGICNVVLALWLAYRGLGTDRVAVRAAPSVA